MSRKKALKAIPYIILL